MLKYFMKFDALYSRSESTSKTNMENGQDEIIPGSDRPVQCHLHIPSHVNCNRMCAQLEEATCDRFVNGSVVDYPCVNLLCTGRRIILIDPGMVSL